MASMTSRSIVARPVGLRPRPKAKGKRRECENVINYTAERRAMRSEKKVLRYGHRREGVHVVKSAQIANDFVLERGESLSERL